MLPSSFTYIKAGRGVLQIQFIDIKNNLVNFIGNIDTFVSILLFLRIPTRLFSGGRGGAYRIIGGIPEIISVAANPVYLQQLKSGSSFVRDAY